jgi:phosphoadenosine phosphosulfate reductase
MSSVIEEIKLRQAEAETWGAAELVSFALQRFSPRIAIASSFGAEDVVLIHLAAQARPDFRVFTLDTDFLFPATYALIDDLERRYRIKVERTRPRLTPEEQAREFGAALWSREPDQCCNLRKVEPLTKKLSELDAWVTGIRRDQAPTRANARKLDWDAKFGLVKINPLADWKWEQVWEYIRSHKVP